MENIKLKQQWRKLDGKYSTLIPVHPDVKFKFHPSIVSFNAGIFCMQTFDTITMYVE